MKINLKGLRQTLRKFDEDGFCVSGKHWKIAKGGYDLYWELYYDNVPVVDCVCNRLERIGIDIKAFNKICQIIIEEYDNNIFEPMIIQREGERWI